MSLPQRHILICTTSYPDPSLSKGQEAAGSFVADFAAALSHHTKVTVVAPSLKEGFDCHDSISVKRFAVPSLPLSLLKPQNPQNWFNIWKTLQVGKHAVYNIVHQKKVDHIFALWALPSGYWARAAAKSAGIDYSIWTLGSDIWSLGRIPLIRSVLKQVLKDSKKCYADGYQLAKDTAAIGGCSCDFLPSSRTLNVSSEKTLTEKPPYKLAFLGRWHVNKGADLLVDALSLLTENDWRNIEEIRFCGGGPLEQRIIPKIKVLQQQGRPIKIKGFLNQQEATELLLWADYLLLPSRIESIPVIFSDAMQTMTPVIATPVGDLPQLLNSFKVGIIAKSSNTRNFSAAISSGITMSPKDFSQNIKKIIIQFDTIKIAETFFNDFLS